MGIDSEIPPGQSSNDWGPLTLQCTCVMHVRRAEQPVPIIRMTCAVLVGSVARRHISFTQIIRMTSTS